MLYQLHWQFKDGHTEMQAQRDIVSFEESREFVKETQESHPVPDDAVWLTAI
jgi:hypothetical protein